MRITRHAKNNIRLYDIDLADIEETVEAPERVDHEGKRISAYRTFSGKYHQHPLKVVYIVEEDEIVVITAYPLRRQARRR
jgi:hypothetical protein